MKKLVIEDIMAANSSGGWKFFREDSLSYFKTKVYPAVYGNQFFIVREEWQGKVYFSIFKFLSKNGQIIQYGDRKYDTLSDAKSGVKLALNRGKVLRK